MKLSLKLPDDSNNSQSLPTLKAKIPITIFSQPFISSLTTTAVTTAGSNQHLSFSLGTNFPSGPSFKLNYTPLPATTTSANPFSFSLKSGLGLFGSPRDSPLVFSAHFSLSSTNLTNFTPTFLLHFKPQMGNFSLHKTTSSPSPNNRRPQSISGANLQSESPSNSGFDNSSVSNESSGWQDVKLEPSNGNGNSSFFNAVDSFRSDGIGLVNEGALLLKDDKKAGSSAGIAVRANTVLPVTKRAMVNLRWGVNFPADSVVKMPYLTVNKIVIERVEKVEDATRKNTESDVSDLELLKGMCFWMKRDFELLEKENKHMKQCLEEMEMGVSTKNFRGISDSIGKKRYPYSNESFVEAKDFSGVSDSSGKRFYPSSSESFGEFDRRRSKKNGEGNGRSEFKKSDNQASDLESELQKAIKAASS